MKGFLLDENLPSRLVCSPGLPLVPFSQVANHPSDSEIWNFARLNELVIVTKDADFSDRILVSEPPPWVIHRRFGNLRRTEFHRFLEQIWPRLEFLLASNKMINVYHDRMEAVS